MRRLKFFFVICMIIVFMNFDFDRAQEEITIEDAVKQDEREFKRTFLIAKVESVVGNTSISEAIVDGCMNTTTDWYLCIKNVVWVANAESSLFKRVSSSNNAFGLMWRNWLMKFSSVEEGIRYRITLYERNKWYNRTNGKARLQGKNKYCASACTNWVGAYDSAIAKLNI